jgi:hypothetical protein
MVVIPNNANLGISAWPLVQLVLIIFIAVIPVAIIYRYLPNVLTKFLISILGLAGFVYWVKFILK